MPDDLPTWWHERRWRGDRRDWSQQAADDALHDEEQADRWNPTTESDPGMDDWKGPRR
jgi:hypothetical protein